MKATSIILLLFLNLFCKLASAQWNDDTLLLRSPSSQDIQIKVKKRKSQTLVVPEPNAKPESIEVVMRKPDQIVPIPDVVKEVVAERTKNSVDLWVGVRKMDHVSKFTYKNFTGETPTLGVKASVFVGEWSWFLLYDTGFYYQTSKNSHLRLRDENLQVGFLKMASSFPIDFYYGISYFEDQIVNENQSIDFIGNKKSGPAFILQKNQTLDESMVFSYGLVTCPLITYKEASYQSSINSGNSVSVITNAIQLGVTEKLDANNSLLINAAYNWTEVQFKGVSSVVDPLLNEPIQRVRVQESNFNVQIGYRWGN